MKSNDGVTLIELMISIVLSVTILSGFLSFYFIIEKHYQERMELIRLTENMRLIHQLFADLVHSLVYQGCKKVNVLEIKSYQGNDLKPGTEGFTIHYLDSMANELVDDMQTLNILASSNENTLIENTAMMISNCKLHEFFVIDKVKQSSNFQTLTTKNNLSILYQKFSTLQEYKNESYYVAKTNRIDNYNKPIYALFLKNKNKQELIENINDLKIKIYILKNGQIIEKTLPLEKNSNLVGVKFSVEHAKSKINQEIYLSLR